LDSLRRAHGDLPRTSKSSLPEALRSACFWKSFAKLPLYGTALYAHNDSDDMPCCTAPLPRDICLAVPQLEARANDSLGLPPKCLDVCLPPYWTALLASHSLNAHKNGASLWPRRRKRSSSSVTSSPFPRPGHEDRQPYRFKYKEHRNTSVYNKRRARRYRCCTSAYVNPLLIYQN
jgi:hypothetical protein